MWASCHQVKFYFQLVALPLINSNLHTFFYLCSQWAVPVGSVCCPFPGLWCCTTEPAVSYAPATWPCLRQPCCASWSGGLACWARGWLASCSLPGFLTGGFVELQVSRWHICKCIVQYGSSYCMCISTSPGFHWLTASFWLISQQPDICAGPWCWRAFNAIMGLIHVFLFLNVKDGPSRFRMASFYAVSQVLISDVWPSKFKLWSRTDGWICFTAIIVVKRHLRMTDVPSLPPSVYAGREYHIAAGRLWLPQRGIVGQPDPSHICAL